MMRKLLVYPNCSKGGVSSVIRGRAANEPDTHFDVLFFNDRGGRQVFTGVSNITMRIIREDRHQAYLQYLTSKVEYDSIHVLSSPSTANILLENENNVVSYEFHSSNMGIVANEIAKIELDKISEFVVPSDAMSQKVAELLPRRVRNRLVVRQNLVDPTIFSPDGPASFLQLSLAERSANAIPLVWVGRFDKDKGYQYAIRALALLPANYFMVFVVSLEHDPERASRFFSECDSMGVRDRVMLLMDLSQAEMANLYRSVRNANGAYVSTSLMESFGYSIVESVSCGLLCVAFDLPVLDLHRPIGQIKAVPIGDVAALSREIKLEASREPAH